jgi:sugar lactone lactonase YvrE
MNSVRKYIYLFLICFIASLACYSQNITTYAGNGNCANNGDGGLATSAEICDPIDIGIDKCGNVYFTTNNVVRKIDVNGVITKIAGGGSSLGDGGPAINAQLNQPRGIFVDKYGNIYIADRANNRIRKIDTLGIIETVAGTGVIGFSGDNGNATSAKISGPLDVAVDSLGNLYITDTGNNRVRKVDTLGIITTIAGNGSSIYTGDNILATSASITVGAY